MKDASVATQPQNWKTVQALGIVFMAVLVLAGVASSQTWTTMASGKEPTFNLGIALQLTDGRILFQDNGTSNWYTLTPNKFGVYRQGTFTEVKSFPSSMNYSPLYFASAVLPDGRVIVEGGEYNNGVENWTNKGAIYDPVKNTWTPVPAPKGWTQIGDAQGVVLSTGTYMIANINNGQSALFDAKTLGWTIVPGAGKNDVNDEEGWTLLPNGEVLTVDTYVFQSADGTGRNSEIYDPTAKTWSSAGDTQVRLWDSHVKCEKQKGGSAHEMGPALLTPPGDQVIAFGANTCTGQAGHVSMYAIPFGLWVAGPDIPNGDDMADAPAALLPSGNILIQTNKGYGQSPSTFYEFVSGGLGYDPVPAPPGYAGNSEGGRMLVMPNLSILLTHVGSKNMWFYTGIEGNSYQSSWRPTICFQCYPTTVTVGDTYKVSGTQFNGFSSGAAFGDDAQSATNYPLVRIRNNSSGEVHYARTHGFSTGVATGSKVVSTNFDVLPGTPTGPSTLVVVANGIPSLPVKVTVK
jgi:hypothetical protein